jgi:hypothetical protein
MRAFTKKSIKDLLQYEPEKKLIHQIVYNIGRNGYPTFEDWFDKKQKLNIDKIFDCNSGVKFDWSEFGNFSKATSYVDFISPSNRFMNSEEDIIDGEKRRIPRIVDGGWMTLGSFRRMNSPSIITLYLDNIQISFWTIIFKLICSKKYKFTQEKIEELAKLAIYKTLFHELFHLYIDAQSYLSEHYIYNFKIDEALAVAFSRIQIGYETKNHSFISDYLDLAYSYTSDGYKDWVNYKGEEQFIHKLIEYIAIDKNLIDLGQEVTPIVEGLLYSIIENPNTEVNILHS